MGKTAEAIFKQIDANNDGELTPSELSMKLSDFGFDESEHEAMFAAMDVNGDGRITLQEFVAGYDQHLSARLAEVSEVTVPQEISLQDLKASIDAAVAEGKTPLFLDKSGRVATFMSYNAQTLSAKDMVTKKFAQKPPPSPEELRKEAGKQVLEALKYGKQLFVDMQNSAPPFGSEFSGPEFPTELIFSNAGAAMKEEANYKALMNLCYTEAEKDDFAVRSADDFVVILGSTFEAANAQEYLEAQISFDLLKVYEIKE